MVGVSCDARLFAAFVWRAGSDRCQYIGICPALDIGLKGFGMAEFDWHSDPITRATPITPTYRSTQNVRRFFKVQCGDHYKFDRFFMAWMKAAAGKTMGDAVEEWKRRQT
jgi:hypothetical protein